MNKKAIFSAIGVIVLGALGSALWDFSKPVLFSFSGAVAELSTLGLESLRNDFYLRAAKSQGRPVGVALSMVFIISTMSLLAAMHFHVLKYSTNPALSSAARIFSIGCLLLAGITTAQTAQTAYTIELASYYELLEVRAAPYLSDQEIKQIRAKFSTVATKQDYMIVVATLSEKIRASGGAVPPPP